MDRNIIPENIVVFLLGAVITLVMYVSAYEDQTIESTPLYEVETVIIEPEENKVDTQAVEVEFKEPVEIGPELIGEFRITAYCACSKCCGDWADGYTFTGTKATEGRTIAVDPEVIPLGSIIKVNGIEYIAEDVGGAIKGNRLDIFFNSHEEALEWGVQYHDVFIIEESID